MPATDCVVSCTKPNETKCVGVGVGIGIGIGIGIFHESSDFQLESVRRASVS